MIQAAQPAQPDDDAAPFLPTPANIPNNGNRLPTDQEIGIQPGSTLVSDPNFNVGSHPGEVYVDNDKKSEKNPPRRYFNDYSKQTSYHPYYKPQQQYPYYSVSKTMNLGVFSVHVVFRCVIFNGRYLFFISVAKFNWKLQNIQ